MGTETTAKCRDCGSSITMWLFPNEALHHQHTSEYGRVLPTSGRWWVVSLT